MIAMKTAYCKPTRHTIKHIQNGYRDLRIKALTFALLAISAPLFSACMPVAQTSGLSTNYSSPTSTVEVPPHEFGRTTISVDNAEDLAEVLRISDKSGVVAAAFSPNGNLIASTHQDGKLKLWDIHTGNLLREFEGHTDTAWQVEFSPDGTMLATTGWDQVVRIWDVESGTPIQVLGDFEDGGGPVHELAFSSDGASLTASNWGSQIYQWDTSSWQVINELQGYLFAFNADNSVMVLTQRTGPTLIKRVSGSVEVLDEDFAEEEYKEIIGIEFIGRTNDILLAYDSSNIEIWNIDEKTMLAAIESYGYGIRDIDSNPEGDLIVVAYDDDKIRVFDVLGHLITILGANITRISSITFSPTGDYFAVSSLDGGIIILSINGAPE